MMLITFEADILCWWLQTAGLADQERQAGGVAVRAKSKGPAPGSQCQVSISHAASVCLDVMHAHVYHGTAKGSGYVAERLHRLSRGQWCLPKRRSLQPV